MMMKKMMIMRDVRVGVRKNGGEVAVEELKLGCEVGLWLLSVARDPEGEGT